MSALMESLHQLSWGIRMAFVRALVGRDSVMINVRVNGLTKRITPYLPGHAAYNADCSFTAMNLEFPNPAYAPKPPAVEWREPHLSDQELQEAIQAMKPKEPDRAAGRAKS